MKRHFHLNNRLTKGALVNKSYSEYLDPKHRYGTLSHCLYSAWAKSKAPLNFKEWLEALERGENVDGRQAIPPLFKISERWEPYFVNGKLNPLIPTVTYLNENERKKYLLEIKKGQFETAHNGTFDRKNDGTTFIFVMAHDNKIYAGAYDRGRFNHTSFLAGGSVKSAGEMFFKNGKLNRITSKTGHYHDNKERRNNDEAMLKILAELRARGVDLSDVTYTRFNHKYDQQDYNALEFLKTNGKAPKFRYS